MVYDFSEILVYLCDPQTHIRKDIRTALAGYGFGMVEDFGTLADFSESIDAHEQPDLLICDADMEDGAAIDLFKQVRHNKCGDNPFVSTIMTTWNPTPERVRAMTNAGIDDLIGKPLSPAQLFDRVKAQITSRKPFVVTAEYIGPDRRKASNRPSSAKVFEVPNTLSARATNTDIPDIGGVISQTWSNVMEERQSRNAFQLAFLVDLILPALQKGHIDPEILGHINRLVQTCQDSMDRLKGGRFPQAADLFKRMTLVAKAIQSNPHEPGQKNIDLLKPLAMAVNKAMNPDKDEAKLAAEISGALDTFSQKKKQLKS